MSLHEIRSLFEKAEYDTALELIDGSDANKLDLLFLRSIAYKMTWRIDEGIETANQLLEESNKTNEETHELKALIYLSYLSILKAAYSFRTISLDYLVKFEKIWNDLSPEVKLELKDIEAYYYHVKGTLTEEYEESVDYYLRSLKIRNELPYKFEIGASLSQLAYFSQLHGEYEKAFFYGKQLLEVATDNGNDGYKSFAYHWIAYYYMKRGEFDQAVDYYKLQIEVSTKLISKYDQLVFYINKYESLVSIYEIEEKWDKSLEACELLIHYLEESKRYLYLPKNLYRLITIALKSSNDKIVEKYLSKLETTVSQSDDDPNTLFFNKLTHAVILKNRKRSKDKIEAQKLFEEILQFDIQKYGYLKIDILLHLSELLLDELKLYGENEVLLEVTDLIRQISDVARDQNLHSIRIQSLLLQGKLAFFNREITLSNTVIQQARSIARDNNLEYFEKIIDDEEKFIGSEIDKASELSDKASPFRTRLEKIKIIDYINEMQKLTRGSQFTS